MARISAVGLTPTTILRWAGHIRISLSIIQLPFLLHDSELTFETKKRSPSVQVRKQKAPQSFVTTCIVGNKGGCTLFVALPTKPQDIGFPAQQSETDA